LASSPPFAERMFAPASLSARFAENHGNHYKHATGCDQQQPVRDGASDAHIRGRRFAWIGRRFC
jgi:hypothetical protein